MQASPDSVLIEQMQTALVLLEPDGTAKRLNAAAEELFGLSRRQPGLDRRLNRLLDHSGLHELMQHARRANQTLAAVGLSLPESEGAERLLDAEITPLGSGQILLELRDATLRRQAREDHALLERRGLSQRVVQQLAHEIRNPLAGLKGAAQMLERMLDAPEAREMAGIIGREVDRLDRLIGEMLSPTQAMKVNLQNIHAVLGRLSELLRNEAGSGVRIEHDYDPSLPEIALDADQMLRALLNLGRNALQAGAHHVVLRTRAARRLTWAGQPHRLALVVEVVDDGCGVPEELAGSLFFPLVTSRADGSGLGLSIAQDIVERHGGQIEYSSSPGHTVFRVLLPLEQAT
ncbi:MAG: nitrogen regulation protein NR(II) [Wenzhouxiangellaceae bacterium]|nr:nitrogen regulation protein NR(II) [Wenzhouxiangellaceae bacterium]